MGLSQQLQEKIRVGCTFNIMVELSDDVPSHKLLRLGKLITNDVYYSTCRARSSRPITTSRKLSDDRGSPCLAGHDSTLLT
jgi:hypothetical protein